MQFLFPTFLWALLALSIPIIIHLFHFRRFKKVYFTNVKFLKEIKEETSNRNSLRNLLILLSRLLALALLVFAFAQPIIFQGDEVKAGRKAVSVFVDNSFSMNATQNNAALLTIAKERARQIINAYGESDEYQIITNELSGRQLNFFDKSTALSHIDEIIPTPKVGELPLIRNVQSRSLSQKNSQKISYIISDFQESISDFENPIDSTIEFNLIQLRPIVEKNISIDECHFLAPVPVLNESNKLLVKLTNHSNEAAENVQLNMIHQGQTRPLGSVSIPSNSSVIDTASITILTTGWHNAEIKIDDYPVTFDDSYHIAFHIKPSVNILNIFENRPNTYLRAAFESLGFFSLNSVQKDQVRYDAISSYDLIILQNLNTMSTGLIAVVTDFVDDGGNVLIFPGTRINAPVYTDVLGRLESSDFGEFQNSAKKVGTINSLSFVFSNVFRKISRNIKLPSTTGNYNVNISQSRASENILTYRDGSPYLVRYALGEGSTYVCSAPLDNAYNDLTSNAEIFIPLLYKAAISSGNRSSAAYTIGVDNIIPTDDLDISDNSKYLVSGSTEFIPGLIRQKNNFLIDVTDQIEKDGVYDLLQNDNLKARLAFNYDRRESNLALADLEKIKDDIGQNVNIIDENLQAGLTHYISQKDQGFRLWKYCIVLALLFLAVETILLRFWKV